MPQPMIATDMLGAIGRSKSGSNNTDVNRCKKCDSTNVYEIEEPEGRVIAVYTVCENCGNKEKIREKKKSMFRRVSKLLRND